MKNKIKDMFQELLEKSGALEDDVIVAPRWQTTLLYWLAGSGLGFWLMYPWLWYKTKPLRAKK